MADQTTLQRVTSSFQAFKQVQNEGKGKASYGLHIIAGSFPLPKVVLGYKEAYYVIDEPSLKRLLTAKHGGEADTNNLRQVSEVLQALLNGSLQGLSIAPTMHALGKKSSPGPLMAEGDFRAVMMMDYARYALIDGGFLREEESRAFVPFGTPLVKLPILVIGGSFD